MTDVHANPGTDHVTFAIAMRLRTAGIVRMDVTEVDLLRAAEGVLHELTHQARRAGLMMWLTEAGVLEPAGMWAVPADPGEELARIADRVKVATTDAELDALQDEEGRLRLLLDSGFCGPYGEGDPRPSSAPEMYVVKEPGRG